MMHGSEEPFSDDSQPTSPAAESRTASVPSTSSDRPHTPNKTDASQRGSQHSKKARKSGKHADNSRPCKEHTFLTDVADVREMEQGLLQLLDDFHSGKLQSFGNDCTFDKLDQVRVQQEQLARLHFELDSQQESLRLESEEGRQLARKHMDKLMEKLQELNTSIANLQKSEGHHPSIQQKHRKSPRPHKQ